MFLHCYVLHIIEGCHDYYISTHCCWCWLDKYFGLEGLCWTHYEAVKNKQMLTDLFSLAKFIIQQTLITALTAHHVVKRGIYSYFLCLFSTASDNRDDDAETQHVIWTNILWSALTWAHIHIIDTSLSINKEMISKSNLLQRGG